MVSGKKQHASEPTIEPATAEPDYGAEARAALDRAMAILRAVEVTPEHGAQILVADHLALVQLLGALGSLEAQVMRVEVALTGLGMLLAGQPVAGATTKIND